MFKCLIRRILSATLYRPGKVRQIIAGPGRGLRYRIFPEYGLSPLLGRWESDAQNLMVKYIQQNWSVFDVGANYGIHTLLMARLASHGRVYAFEPVPLIFAELQSNVALNGFKNVRCVRVAISDRVGPSEFVEGHHAGAGHLVQSNTSATRTLSVPTTTLDDFISGEGNQPPSLVKVDVEGAESKVLLGASRTLSEVRPVILLDLHTQEQDCAVGAILQSKDYSVYRTNTGEKINRLDRGWPDPDGIWGQIIAFPN